jgi:hypothetical protein
MIPSDRYGLTFTGGVGAAAAGGVTPYLPPGAAWGKGSEGVGAMIRQRAPSWVTCARKAS